jgi:hypothetical protein
MDEYYKTKFCSKYPYDIANCEYGKLCSFSHSERDIKIELIHNYVFDLDFYMFKYKTVNCPFNLLYHDKALCVYSHNWQDYRRSPELYKYEPVKCPHWETNKMIYEYAAGCPNGLNCTKCHGWKELEFHPMYYKMHPCSSSSSCNNEGLSCPFYHSVLDQRNSDELFNEFDDQIWVYSSRNRVVQGVFKPPEFEAMGMRNKVCSIDTHLKINQEKYDSSIVRGQKSVDCNSSNISAQSYYSQVTPIMPDRSGTLRKRMSSGFKPKMLELWSPLGGDSSRTLKSPATDTHSEYRFNRCPAIVRQPAANLVQSSTIDSTLAHRRVNIVSSASQNNSHDQVNNSLAVADSRFIYHNIEDDQRDLRNN